MFKMNTKKLIAIILATFIILLFSCDYNAPLRKKMIKYYSDDNNYYQLDGVVISINDIILEIDILTPNHVFPINTNGYQRFIAITTDSYIVDLSEGDKISFTSAPMHFYNGHYLPIISIKKGDTVYMTFEEGKKLYLEFINTVFS